jgi:hypothetical protein
MEAMSEGMATFAARLASFDIALPIKQRVSGAKGVTAMTWPHSRPSPAEVFVVALLFHESVN